MILHLNETKTVYPDSSDICLKYGIINKTFRLIEGDIDIPDKGLVIFSGISGSGKSACLNTLSSELSVPVSRVDISQVRGNKLLKDTNTDLSKLTNVGLSDIVTLLTPLDYLSDGQKYRLGLLDLITNNTVIIDEFCNQLDEMSTIGIMRMVSRLAQDKLIIVATSRPYGYEYVDCDFYNINQGLINKVDVSKKNLINDIEWRLGKRKDWEYFSQWHYRSGSCGISTRVIIFSYKDYDFGVILTTTPPLAISLRNRLFPEYKSNGKLVNKEIYYINRIVITPEFRGLGLSKYMFDVLHETCFTDKKMAEIITSLDFLPFAERAGFSFGGIFAPNSVRTGLAKLDFDFSKYLNDNYVNTFVTDNYDKVYKLVVASKKGTKCYDRLSEFTFDEVISAVVRMCNTQFTRYYYKRFDDDRQV